MLAGLFMVWYDFSSNNLEHVPTVNVKYSFLFNFSIRFVQ